MNEKLKSGFRFMFENYSVIFYFFVITAASLVFLPEFATQTTIANLVRQAAIPVIGCVALNFMMIAGNIDLSAPYVMGVVSIVAGICSIQLGLDAFTTITLCILVGTAFGIFNGFIVAYLKVPAFITTLGSGYIAYGISLIIAEGLYFINLPRPFMAFGNTEVLGIMIMAYYAVVITLAAYYVVKKTKYGRDLTVLGLNRRVAFMSGVRINRVLMISYVICGTLIGLCGVLTTIRVGTSQVSVDSNFVFEAVTACVLGGSRLSGGKANIIGGLFGALIIKEINVIITILGVNMYLYQAALAILIFTAIVAEAIRDRGNR